MKLYILTTAGFGNFYVVAENPNSAEVKLKGLLNKADYGFYKGRTISDIEMLAEEIGEFPKGHPEFSPDLWESRLILPNSCENKVTQVDSSISKLLSTD